MTDRDVHVSAVLVRAVVDTLPEAVLTAPDVAIPDHVLGTRILDGDSDETSRVDPVLVDVDGPDDTTVGVVGVVVRESSGV